MTSIAPTASTQWLQTYHPQQCADVVGHSRTMRNVREWLQKVQTHASGESTGKSPPPITFLYGAGGIGKTTVARVLLQQCNYHIYELNSGEVRSKKRIEETFEKILNNHSVSMMKKKNRQQTLGIVMDEIDGMSCGDKGGLHELFNIVAKQHDEGVVVNPVICISNRPYDKKLSKDLYQEFQMRRPSEAHIIKRLRYICDCEHVNIEDLALVWIAQYGNRDVRRTIHFLQEVVYYFGANLSRRITTEDVDTVKAISSKMHTDHNLFDITRAIFTCTLPFDEMHEMYQTDPMLVRMMVHENLPTQLQQKHIDNTVNVYGNVMHNLSLIDALSSHGSHWELSFAYSGMCCGYANTGIGSQPSKMQTPKTIQFTNTLTKSATQANIHHTLDSLSQRLQLHNSLLPYVVPLVLTHIVQHPEDVTKYQMTFGELEKLTQVYQKWLTGVPTRKGARKPPPWRVLPRIKKEWKTRLSMAQTQIL